MRGQAASTARARAHRSQAGAGRAQDVDLRGGRRAPRRARPRPWRARGRASPRAPRRGELARRRLADARARARDQYRFSVIEAHDSLRRDPPRRCPMKLGLFFLSPRRWPTPRSCAPRARRPRKSRLRLHVGRRARGAVRRVRLEVPVLGRRAHPRRRHVRHPRAVQRAHLPGRLHQPDPARHGHLPRASTQSGVHGEGSRDRRLAVGRSAGSRRRRRLAGRGVQGGRRPLRAPRRALPLLPGSDEAPVVRSGVGAQGRVLRAAGVPRVPQARPDAAPADPLRRRERGRAAPRRRRGAGLVRLQPRTGGARRSPEAPRPASRRERPPPRGRADHRLALSALAHAGPRGGQARGR